MTMNASSDKLTELRERGWVRLEGAVDPETVAAFLKTVHVLSTAPASAGARVPFLNQGHQMIYNLQGKDFTVLRTFLSHPALRSIFTSVLNDEWYRSLPAGSPNYILRSLLARSSGPASMPLHIDSFIPANSSFAWSAQAAIVLEDQTVENGCTVAVPGSHRFDRYADQAAITTAEPIPSKAGDIVIWDSRSVARGRGKQGRKDSLVSHRDVLALVAEAELRSATLAPRRVLRAVDERRKGDHGLLLDSAA